MVSAAVLPLSVATGRVVPHFLDARDESWVALLQDEYQRFVDAPKASLVRHFRGDLPFFAPPFKLRLARYTLDRLWRAEVRAAVRPREARQRVFQAATVDADRHHVLEQVAAALGVAPQALSEALFADLPGERRMVAPSERPSPTELCLRANLLLVQGLLERSVKVMVQVWGNARPVVRLAKLRGLLCSVLPGDREADARIEISGPLSLFRRTLLYGRSLAELVPHLAWCNRYCLDAKILWQGELLPFRVSSGAPLYPARPPRRFDSKLEERFARDFAKCAPDWHIVREPQPVKAGRSLIFPDFALVRRSSPRSANGTWLLEIAGFWTPEYLHRKLTALRAARIENLVICVDAERNCAEHDFPGNARIVRYRRKVDAGVVLAIIEGDERGQN